MSSTGVCRFMILMPTVTIRQKVLSRRRFADPPLDFTAG
jgi:hypothetical protein